MEHGDMEHLMRLKNKKFSENSIAQNMMVFRKNMPDFAEYIFGIMQGGCGIVSIETITTDIYTDIVQFADGSQLAIIEGQMRWVPVDDVPPKTLAKLREKHRDNPVKKET